MQEPLPTKQMCSSHNKYQAYTAEGGVGMASDQEENKLIVILNRIRKARYNKNAVTGLEKGFQSLNSRNINV